MVKLIAHRGARSLAPENTLAAAKIAWALGAHGWETDVSLTRDRHLVLFHDPGLSRCTNAPVRFGYPPSQNPEAPGIPEDFLIHYTLAELQTLDAGSYFRTIDPFSTLARGRVTLQELEAFSGEPIPTLAQGLELTRDLGFLINIELKDHGVDPHPFYTAGKTLESIRKTRIPREQVVISSFNHDWLIWITRQAPEIEIQALVGYEDDQPLVFGDFSFQVYNANARVITEPMIQELKERGKQVNLWTVNDPHEFNRFVRAGVDGIITDFPQEFVQKKRP